MSVKERSSLTFSEGEVKENEVYFLSSLGVSAPEEESKLYSSFLQKERRKKVKEERKRFQGPANSPSEGPFFEKHRLDFFAKIEIFLKMLKSTFFDC